MQTFWAFLLAALGFSRRLPSPMASVICLVLAWVCAISAIYQKWHSSLLTGLCAVVLLILGYFLSLWLLKKPEVMLNKLLGRCSSSLIPLQDASDTLYGAMRVAKHLETYLAERMAKSEDDLRRFVAWKIMQVVPVFGRRPPSRIIEQLDPQVVSHSRTNLEFQNGIAHMASSYSDQPGIFTDLSVRQKDLFKVLSSIKQEAANDLHQRLRASH